MRLVMIAATLLGVATIAACRQGSGSERAGDTSYGAAQYDDALVLYQAAVQQEPAARIWAKVGAAALRAGKGRVAVDAYLRLAGEDPTRADEAAEGIEIVARNAERAGDIETLQTAVAGLVVVAPERVAGRFAVALARRSRGEPADLVTVLPGAVAAATDPQMVDSLLGLYANALRETDGCRAAEPIYRSVVRRTRDQGLLDSAGAGLAQCAEVWDVTEPPTEPDSIAELPT